MDMKPDIGCGEAAGLRCRSCGQLVDLIGGDGLPGEFRMAVHTATGQEKHPEDGHLAAPVEVATAIDPWTSDRWRRLQLGWDEAYAFEHDPAQPEPFSAARRDERATVLRAPDPEALRKRVADDYDPCPVAMKCAS